jgi:hypothetical protein
MSVATVATMNFERIVMLCLSPLEAPRLRARFFLSEDRLLAVFLPSGMKLGRKVAGGLVPTSASLLSI